MFNEFKKFLIVTSFSDDDIFICEITIKNSN